MVILTCKNHPKQRWACKGIAWTPKDKEGNGTYNGCRSIFHFGVLAAPGSASTWTKIDPDTGEWVEECKCPSSDLVLAPEQLRDEKGIPVDEKGLAITH